MIMRCFACDRKLGVNPWLVDTRDAQSVYVGSECYKKIKQAGEEGWQPPKGGPRLWLFPNSHDGQLWDERHTSARRKAKEKK